MPNLYANLADIKAELDITDTSKDAILLSFLEDASREVDSFCRRWFYPVSGVRYYHGARYAGNDATYYAGSYYGGSSYGGFAHRQHVLTDDILSITTLLTDSTATGDFSLGESWVENTDYILAPYNYWPKVWVETAVNGRYGFVRRDRYVQITGIFGYGDGLRQSPWDSAGINATVATTTGTTLTVSADGILAVGNTILVESEQMYVSAVATGNVTVRRAQNGTTAAAHLTAAVYLPAFPRAIVRETMNLAKAIYNLRKASGFQSETIGSYNYQLAHSAYTDWQMNNALGFYQREIA